MLSRTSRIHFVIAFAFLVFLVSCGNRNNSEEYIVGIRHWQQLRIDSLKGKTGYLNLAGLYWLETGKNTFGSDTLNKFVFPEKAPGYLGHLYLNNDSVWLVQKHPEVKVAGGLVGDSILVYSNALPRISMRYVDLSWYIIKRGSDYGIRLKDYSHPLLSTFNDIENFPIDEKWRVKASWVPYPEPKLVKVKNQVGMDLLLPCPGQFHFTIDGTSYTLEPTGSADDMTYFTMIYDQTSGEETYGSGRYIDVPRPDENGETYIDFNKAYNPPCAFTEFATCTFPHAANRLPIRIEAGEKFNGHH